MILSCDQCALAILQGIPCHETGCPDSWIDPQTGKGYVKGCSWCGLDFAPDDRHQTFCDDSCAEAYHG